MANELMCFETTENKAECEMIVNDMKVTLKFSNKLTNATQEQIIGMLIKSYESRVVKPILD